MGRAKEAYLAAQERGWQSRDTTVCSQCIQVEALAEFVEEHATHNACSYCGEKADEPIAVAFDELMQRIMETVRRYYAEPNAAGTPYVDGEYLDESIDTHEMLFNLDFEVARLVYEDVIRAIDNHDWIPCAGQTWLGRHPAQIWHGAWRHFSQYIKHESRFVFLLNAAVDDEPDSLPVSDVLDLVAQTARSLELFETLPAETMLYRVRVASDGEILETLQEVGPPPKALTTAGRMNPAGIPYLYTALEAATGIAETVKAPPTRVGLARFATVTPLTVLDLTRLGEPPDIWDEDYLLRQQILFFRDLIDSITAPVAKDGMEHVSYVPTQVIAEYVRHVVKHEGLPVNGVLYPSAIRPGGRNLVLFPIEEDWTALVRLFEVEMLDIENWPQLTAQVT